MYLSELFLQHIGENPTPDKVRTALEKCNQQICTEMAPARGQEISTALLFTKDKDGNITGLNKKGQEILDFWDVYKEFDSQIPKETRNQLALLQAADALRSEIQIITRRSE